MNPRPFSRPVVLYSIFAVLLVTGWHELPVGDSMILPWYVIAASALIPATIARFWR